MLVKLEDRFPILEVSWNCIMSKMGDITIAFEVIKPEVFTLGASDYDLLHQSFVKGLKVLPERTVIHMQDLYQRDQTKIQRNETEASFLQQANDRFFQGRPFLRHRCRIYLTMRPDGRRAVSSGTSGLLRKTLVPADTLSSFALREFEGKSEQFSRILTDSGLVSLRRIPNEELVSSSRKAGVIEEYCYLLDQPDLPVIRDIGLEGELRVGEKHAVLFSLADPEYLPGKCSTWVNYDRYGTDGSPFPIGFSTGLGLLLPFDHMYSQFFVIGDQAGTVKRLEGKRRRLQSLANYSRENAVSRDATDEMLNEAAAEQRTLGRAHFHILAWTEDPSELKDIRSAISSQMAKMDAVAREETIGAPQLWWAGIPGNAGDLPDNECFDTFLEQACCFFNLETNYRSSDSPFSIRFGDRLTGRPVNVDMDVEAKAKALIQNGNLFVLSGSGGGKSYWVNHVCRSYHDLGMHIVIVDVGHSYRGLCELLGGYYFTYTEAEPIRFNPFHLSPGEVFDTEKKESLKSLLLALWKRSDEVQYRSEYVALSNALQAYYAWLRLSPDVFPCFDSFFEFMEGQYVAMLRRDKVTGKEFDVENFLFVVKPFYKGGEFDFLLNATENLDLLSQRLIVFELDNIRDNVILLPVVTLVIMDVFMAKMRKLRGVRKMVVIEEAWKAIANAGMAENIRYWVKTLRKFMGKLALVSQEVDDMVNSPIVRMAIINNSDIKVLLDQSKFANRFGEIQALLGISDKQKAEILSINKGHAGGRVYKDFWLCLGPSHSMVYRLETSLEEYLAYTSDHGEKVRVEEYARKYGSLRRGIEVLVEEMRSGRSLL